MQRRRVLYPFVMLSSSDEMNVIVCDLGLENIVKKVGE